MSTLEDSDTCMVCEKPVRSPLFDICRQYERTIFLDGDQTPEVEVIASEMIETFCSAECLKKGRDQVLVKENVRATFPGPGPIESCSRCGRPVDMTRFHLTWTEEEAIVERSGLIGEMQPVDGQMLAVVCEQCAPAPTKLI